MFYKKFIQEYPASPLRSQALFELAELEYFAKRYPEAALTYKEVADVGQNSDYLEEAAYGYLLSEVKRLNFSLQENDVVRPARDDSGKILPASQPTIGEDGFLKAARYYVTAVPHGTRRQRVLYRCAEIFLKHNQFGKTREALEMLLKDKDTSSLSTNAVRMIALTYDMDNNLQKVVETNRRLLIVAPTADTKSADPDSALKAGSQALLVAWHTENEGRLSESATQYEQYAIFFPKAEDAPFALFHAGVLYRRTAQISASNRMFNRLLKEYPDCKYIPQAEFFKAANDESLVRFEVAVAGYESFGRKHSAHFMSAEAFLNAAALRRGMHQYDKAAADMEEYYKRVGDEEVLFQTAELYKEANKPEMALRIYNRFASGKYGRDNFIRGLLGRAMLSSSPSVGTKVLSKAFEDCLAVEAAGRKYGNTLSATAQQAVVGCQYVRTWPERNELLKTKDLTSIEGLDARLDKLFKKYGPIEQSKQYDWFVLALSDAGQVSEYMASKVQSSSESKAADLRTKALTFYKKAYALRDKTLTHAIPNIVMSRLKDLSPQTIVFSGEDHFWVSTITDTRLVAVHWSSESSDLKPLFDQKKWRELEAASRSELTVGDPQAYIYESLARAQAEQGRWTEARANLVTCVEKTKDIDCVADLLGSGYMGPKVDSYKSMLEEALKTESTASWKMALAEVSARQGKLKEALAFALESITQDPQYVPSYEFVARLFIEADRPELARVTLDEGLKNTEGVEELQLQKGHLALYFHLDEQLQVLMEDFQAQDKNSGRIKAFMARYYLARDQKKEADDIFKQIPDSDPDRSDVLVAKFYFTLSRGDGDQAEKEFAAITTAAKERPTAGYLAGIYLENFKKDWAQAYHFLSKAREEGAWGKLLDVALTSANTANEERQPSSSKEKP